LNLVMGALLMVLAVAAAPAGGWPPADGNYAPAEDVSCRAKAPRVAYPPSLSRRGIGGQVVYRVTVDDQDRFVGATVHESSGHAQLDAAGLKVLPRWCFRAGMQHGRPIGGDILVPIRFTP